MTNAYIAIITKSLKLKSLILMKLYEFLNIYNSYNKLIQFLMKKIIHTTMNYENYNKPMK